MEDYLRPVDAVAPRLIDGFYIVGSLALGDYQEQQSDVDFVALTTAELSCDQIGVLRSVHATLSAHGRHFDGVYLTWGDLAQFNWLCW